MKLWDPHFHIWKALTGAAGAGDDAGYALADYERDVASDGFELIGGTFLEVTSARLVGVVGAPFAAACAAEAEWVSRRLAESPRPYVMAASAPLEYAGVGALLDKLAADDAVRGVRQILNHQPSWPRNEQLGNLLDDAGWRRGFGLCWRSVRCASICSSIPHQFAQAARVVAAHPRVPVVINHLGTPTLADLRAGDTYWEGMRALADCAHTTIKLSMLSYIDPDWAANSLVTESVLRIIELFGTARCFFASNFPVDKDSGWPADRLFGAFARLVSGMREAEQQRLFADNAMRFYGVDEGAHRTATPLPRSTRRARWP